MPEIEEIEQTDSELLSDSVEVPEVDEIDEIDELEKEEAAEEEDHEKKKEETDEDKQFPYERPSIQEIKAKYPDFFKDFPIFRDVVFREAELTKIYPTIEDAREALDDSQILVGLRESVLSGKSEDVFDAIKEADAKAAQRFALTFLPTLRSKDQELYSQTITPLFENLTRTLYNSSDENTRNAALVVAQFLFGKDGEGIAAGAKTFARDLKESDEEIKLKKERQEFETNKYKEFEATTKQDLGSQRRMVILRGLDPEKTMTTSQKEMLVERIVKLVDQSLAADPQHMKVMNARWNRALKEGFNNASKEKIISAYLSRAKQVIPSIRDKERDDFFGTKKKSSQKKVEEIDSKSSSRKEVTGGRVSSSNGTKQVLKPGRDLYRKMSDLDILNT